MSLEAVGLLFQQQKKHRHTHARFYQNLHEQAKCHLRSFILKMSSLHSKSLSFPQSVSLKLLYLSHCHPHTHHPFRLLPHGAAQRSTENLLRLFLSKEYITGSNKLSRCIMGLHLSSICSLTAHTSG